ncbi:hypothetical protein LTR95_010838 [Oleoguttula sp. CCFEE 5521]
MLDEETKASIVSTCKAIADHFGYTLQRGTVDGAVWPTLYEVMPPDWDWDDFTTFCKARLWSLTYRCNRWWETTETIASIACLVFHELHKYHHGLLHSTGNRDASMQASDFLGLPITLDVHNPLMLSIGKKKPGVQMVSGWPLCPTKLANFEPEKCTMRVDTTFSNYFRRDYGSNFESPLRDLVIQFHTTKFDSTMEAPTGFTTAAKTSATDEWDMAQVDSDFTQYTMGDVVYADDAAAADAPTGEDPGSDGDFDPTPAKKKKKTGALVPPPNFGMSASTSQGYGMGMSGSGGGGGSSEFGCVSQAQLLQEAAEFRRDYSQQIAEGSAYVTGYADQLDAAAARGDGTAFKRTKEDFERGSGRGAL